RAHERPVSGVTSDFACFGRGWTLHFRGSAFVFYVLINEDRKRRNRLRVDPPRLTEIAMRCLFVVLSLLVLPILPATAQEWMPIDLGTTATLRAIEQGSTPVRYLVGDGGYVAQSDEAFTGWTPVDVGTSVDL